MPELVVERVASASALRRALSPGAASEHGTVDGETLVVDDAAAAAALVDTYPNVRWADADTAPDTTRADQTPRGELGADGATYRCGVNDCSREVDAPGDTCWQHDAEGDA
jgi:hypothetical protein